AVNFNTTDDAGDKWNNTSFAVLEANSGPAVLCAGSSVTLSNSTSGGAWSSSASGTAGVTSGGVVTGVTSGTAVITYNAGASGLATPVVPVTPTPASIGGPTSACIPSPFTLTDAVTGGTWTTASSAVTAAGGGVFTPVSAGTALISYTLPGGCSATHVVTV